MRFEVLGELEGACWRRSDMLIWGPCQQGAGSAAALQRKLMRIRCMNAHLGQHVNWNISQEGLVGHVQK